MRSSLQMCKAILLIHQKLWILDQCTTEALNRTQQVCINTYLNVHL